jgi:SAM-dependent methyltransferase
MTQRDASVFDARRYWEARLGRNWNYRGVGFRRLGERFNSWAYRLRGEVFDRVVASHVPDVRNAHVLDIGSGTGFYIEAWLRQGARSIVGVDLTDAAVSQLRRRFPDITFVRGDVGEDLPVPTRQGYFDAATAMDVLFHIVDDRRFNNALKNIAAQLRPGGTFLFSDMFLRKREVRREHVAYRRLRDIERALAAADLEIVTRTPMFVYMMQPLDSDSRLVRGGWTALAAMASVGEPVGDVMGRTLYAIDSRLMRRRGQDSPSTEIMVCRRR